MKTFLLLVGGTGHHRHENHRRQVSAVVRGEIHINSGDELTDQEISTLLQETSDRIAVLLGRRS